ncbi:amino acid ABC transporter substrate-binding protein (PAAT family) [Rhizobium sp. PP-F2F-G38]|uniref:Transporter substrate-binding domain-containing protein n=1 Tax=Ferranicluibacter rubi TaxID=2715133 RepID=A0AA43ZEL2_9HYPH|nr:transporter substrate-binding domain-containing protein [Ferranicluibacter rubi]NHT75533.1 transporter substrate-binding domain-containing protein [Ferranicluibacter rubi]PYE33918.1 amino acid ABC transporter substrate-binding protein (PAAT family) [Rhizobium sp. PP-WC-1G-195]PYE94441.1 amino acid ABC transporter substrate-binding protein (PAAT family) [Rhizobium sp. PP-F2F-G38]TCQ23758.1 amino acid ABC transporter substrate-binding protein (PAAT family) [Rhizobium sp. PP-CC-3G-465]
MNRRNLLSTISAAAFALVIGLPVLGGSNAMADTLADIQQRGKIRIAVDLGSPPFGMTDAQMQPTGSDIESARLVAEALGVELELVQVTGPNRVPALLTGQADIVMASFSVNAERKKVIDFTDAYGVIQIVVAAGSAGANVTKPEDLNGVQVGTTRGSTNDLEATAKLPGAQLTRYDDDATLVTALVSGQVDVMASSLQIMSAVNQRRTADPLTLKIVLKTNPYAIGLRKGDDTLKAKLNEVIAENLKNGKLSEIYNRYTGVPLPATLPKT